MRETRVWSLGREDPWRRKWQPTPVLLPGKFHGWGSLVGCGPWGRKESDTSERLNWTELNWCMYLVSPWLSSKEFSCNAGDAGFIPWSDPLEEGMATHSSFLPGRMTWTEEPSRLQSMGLQSQTWLGWLSTHRPHRHTHTHTQIYIHIFSENNV